VVLWPQLALPSRLFSQPEQSTAKRELLANCLLVPTIALRAD